MTHTGQCSASDGATSQMWQKKAVPIPLDKVYLGVNVKSTPSAAAGVSLSGSGPNDVNARSRPVFCTKVSRDTVNWQNAP